MVKTNICFRFTRPLAHRKGRWSPTMVCAFLSHACQPLQCYMACCFGIFNEMSSVDNDHAKIAFERTMMLRLWNRPRSFCGLSRSTIDGYLEAPYSSARPPSSSQLVDGSPSGTPPSFPSFTNRSRISGLEKVAECTLPSVVLSGSGSVVVKRVFQQPIHSKDHWKMVLVSH